MSNLKNGGLKLENQAGIAIGPILFIIAILAILAAAIAAGSGSFTGGTTTESGRTKSSALVQIGENLKVGMDRITMEGGLIPTDVDTNLSHTSQTTALFSPVGGGISVPSVSMANDPLHDKWYFVQGPINGLGTGTANNVMAVLPISYSVCQEVNNRTTGNPAVPAAAALGDFTANEVTGSTAWPAADPNLLGVSTGCVNNSSVTLGNNASPTSNFFFYQVLGIQ